MFPTEPPAEGAQATAGATPTQTPGWAWGICWLMFACTVLNYMDRQAMALVRPQIQKEFHLNYADFGWVLAVFSLTYALFQVPAGYLVDRLDVRLTYAGAVAWWSLAAMAAAFAPSLAALMVLRGLLGVGESFNWPCALRVTATILPPADRSLGNGIFNSGAAVGAVLTPLIVTLLTARFGWRTSFVSVGVLGFIWVAFWLRHLGGERRSLFVGRGAGKGLAADADGFSEPPPGLSMRARGAFGGVIAASVVLALSALWMGGLSMVWWGITLLMVGLLVAARAVPLADLKGADWALSLGEVVRLRRFWVLVVVSVSINICWHFLVNWLPSYLNGDRAMTYVTSGLLTMVPFLAADAGNLGGGAVARYFAGRGFTPVRARMLVLGICTLLITSGAFVGKIQSDALVIVVIGVMAMAIAAFMANYFAFAQEVSTRHTGLVVGILGGLGNLFVAGFLPFVGMVKDRTGSFAPLFVLVGLLPYVGMAALVLGWGSDPESGEAQPS